MNAVIACEGGCPVNGSANWAPDKPGQIFYDFKNRTRHFEMIMKNDRVGCSAYRSGDVYSLLPYNCNGVNGTFQQINERFWRSSYNENKSDLVNVIFSLQIWARADISPGTSRSLLPIDSWGRVGHSHLYLHFTTQYLHSTPSHSKLHTKLSSKNNIKICLIVLMEWK